MTHIPEISPKWATPKAVSPAAASAMNEGMLFAAFKTMSIIDPVCEHCDEVYQGTAYRVTSEEDGVILLNMIVCHSCSIEARRLGLQTHEHDIRHAAFN